MSNGDPFKFNFGLGSSEDDEDEYKKRLFGSIDPGLRQKMFGAGNWSSVSSENNPVYASMWSAEKSRLLNKKQKLFDIAAEGGAKDGGPAIGGGGTSGLDYVAQRDITKTFPGAMSKEEEEYQRMLRAYVGPVPGLMTG
jgi:hypothetical protein